MTSPNVDFCWSNNFVGKLCIFCDQCTDEAITPLITKVHEKFPSKLLDLQKSLFDDIILEINYF